MIYLSIVVGLALLGLGGEALVRGSSTVALRLRVSPLFVGLVFVGFGTSMPELTTSVAAVIDGSPGIAIGNVVGSNIANLTLILGIGAAMAPVVVSRRSFSRDGAIMVLSTGLLAALVIVLGAIDRWLGLVLVALLAFYVVSAARTENHRSTAPEAQSVQAAMLVVPILIALAGLVSVVGGAALLVDGATQLATRLGMSETVIGLTIVAVGTSLPEMATTIVAAIRGQTEVAFGNVIGSCIFNILGIIGVSAAVKPLEIPAEIARFDIWILLAVTALATVFAMTGRRLGRIEGLVLLLVFVAYTAVLLVPGLRHTIA